MSNKLCIKRLWNEYFHIINHLHDFQWLISWNNLTIWQKLKDGYWEPVQLCGLRMEALTQLIPIFKKSVCLSLVLFINIFCFIFVFNNLWKIKWNNKNRNRKWPCLNYWVYELLDFLLKLTAIFIYSDKRYFMKNSLRVECNFYVVLVFVFLSKSLLFSRQYWVNSSFLSC